jgi:hypothetical protein
MYLEKAQAVMQLADIESTVFMITLYWKEPDAKAPLKLGQYIHKKMVPTMAISSELYDPTHFPDSSLIALLGWKKKEAPIPK